MKFSLDKLRKICYVVCVCDWCIFFMNFKMVIKWNKKKIGWGFEDFEREICKCCVNKNIEILKLLNNKYIKL